MLTVYGIPNCDTVKKAREWLRAHAVGHEFHDYKKQGVDGVALARWVDSVGWEALINRSGTTFRKVPDADKADLDRARAIALMIAHPSLIRRPIVDGSRALLIGFRPEIWAEQLHAA
jgi:arsenate reductase (glutaredoxin)